MGAPGHPARERSDTQAEAGEYPTAVTRCNLGVPSNVCLGAEGNVPPQEGSERGKRCPVGNHNLQSCYQNVQTYYIHGMCSRSFSLG